MPAVTCPQCETRLQVPATAAGSRMACPECQAILAVPDSAESLAAVAATAPVASSARRRASVPPQHLHSASDEPWYYHLIGVVAALNIAAGLVACGIQAFMLLMEPSLQLLIVMVGTGLAAAFTAAILLLALDIGRSLRRLVN